MPGTPRVPIVENPFASRAIRPGAIPFELPSGGRLHALASPFRHRRLGALVGPHGTGKSSLLKGLQTILADDFECMDAWQLHQSHYSTSWQSIQRSLRSEKPTLRIIDGFEQLAWWHRHLIRLTAKRHGSGLLVTTHQTMRGFPTLWQTDLNDGLARKLTMRLLSPHPRQRQVLMSRFETHWARHRPNLRETWFAMYDEFERLRGRPMARSNDSTAAAEAQVMSEDVH